MSDEIEKFGTDVDKDETVVPYDEPVRGYDDMCDDTDSKIKNFNDIQWTAISEDEFRASGRSQERFKAGIYEIDVDNNIGIYFRKKKINIDDLIEFNVSIYDTILSEIDKFWEVEDIFKHYGFLHRRGYILFGPAGSGKSAVVNIIMNKLIDRDGVVFLCNDRPDLFVKGLKIFRKIEPNRNIICIFEDIDEIVHRYGESEILSFLDGEEQLDRIINIATTNYPEKLDKRIVARPRRFDRIIEVGMPNKIIRTEYFSKKLKIKDNELIDWVSVSKGLSFAAMSDLVISVKGFDKDLHESAKALKELMDCKITSDSYTNNSVGFGGNDDDD